MSVYHWCARSCLWRPEDGIWWLWDTWCVLRTNFRSSRKARSAFNCWAFSLAPAPALYEKSILRQDFAKPSRLPWNSDPPDSASGVRDWRCTASPLLFMSARHRGLCVCCWSYGVRRGRLSSSPLGTWPCNYPFNLHSPVTPSPYLGHTCCYCCLCLYPRVNKDWIFISHVIALFL